MDKIKVFNILGITATKDENAIKIAYRKKLVQVNPEDDPDGFKLLREAYEEAIRLAKMEEDENPPDTPVDQWIKKAVDIYDRRSTRLDEDCWRELFEEEICSDFDTGSQVREAFLVFLMDNFRLPVEIWKLIEQYFRLKDSREELYEKFPRDFIDFVTEEPEAKGWFIYSHFSGDDEADIDEFINNYLSFRRMNDFKQYDGVEQLLDTLSHIDLWHPYLEIEKMRFYLSDKRVEDAAKIADTLKMKDYDDLYIKYYIALLSLESGDLEDALERCTAILDLCPDHFGARTILYSYYYHTGEYQKAKDGYLELIEIDRYSETLHKGIQDTNVELIKEYKERLQSEPDNKELEMELGWCLFQNKLYEECLNFLANIKITEDTYYSYYNLMSRVYLEMEDYKRALPFVKKWLDRILMTEDEGSQETRRILNRLGLAYYAMSRCYYSFAMEKEDNREDLRKCLENLDLAIKAEKAEIDLLQYLSSKAQTLLLLKEDKLCIDVCDEILRRDKSYFSAYCLRQEACFNLDMAEEVIDDYYKAVEIYAENPAPYIYAIKIFIAFGRFQDAAEVINRAKTAAIENEEIVFLETKNRRHMAEDNEQRKTVAKELAALYEKAGETESVEERARLLNELAACYYDMGDYVTALAYIDRELRLKNSEESMVLKGDILYSVGKYDAAADIYEDIYINYPDNANSYYKMGLYYIPTGRQDKAVKMFLKTLEIEPEHQSVNCELTDIYKRRYRDSFNREDYDLAVMYAKKQVELSPDSNSYTNLGLVYLDGYELNEAINAFEEAIKLDETNMYPYNNIGHVYKVLGHFDEAYKYYILAIERNGDQELLPYWNLADCLRSMGEYEKAVETYGVITEKNGDPEEVGRKLLDTYKQMKDWEGALKQAGRNYDITRDRMDYLLESADIYCFLGNRQKALDLYAQTIKEFPKMAKPYSKMGSYMLWIEGNTKKALKFHMKACRLVRWFDRWNETEVLNSAALCLKKLGKAKKGKKHIKRIYSITNKKFGSINTWLSNLDMRKARLYHIALWNYNTGEYDKTRHYMKLMKKAGSCAHCTYGICYEYLELEGLMLELEGNYREALEKFQRALEISPTNIHYLDIINELKDKVLRSSYDNRY